MPREENLGCLGQFLRAFIALFSRNLSPDDEVSIAEDDYPNTSSFKRSLVKNDHDIEQLSYVLDIMSPEQLLRIVKAFQRAVEGVFE